MKNKVIIALTIIVIIIVALCWLLHSGEKTLDVSPADNTIYVQSNSPGECRAIIIPMLDDAKSSPSEILCKVQPR